MKKILLTTLLLSSLVLFGCSTSSVSVAPAEQVPTQADVTTATGLTLAEVEKHTTETDCWTIIKDKVYDLGAYVQQHPGGPKSILSLCGKDGTAAFSIQHAGQENPQKALDALFVADLRK